MGLKTLRFTGLSAVAGAAFSAGLGAFALMSVAIALGQYLPSRDPSIDYILGVVWAIALLVGLALLPDTFADRRVLMIGWTARIGVTLGAMLLYEGKYNLLDAYGYFRDGGMAPESFPVVFGDGTALLTRLVHLHRTWILDSYHATKVSFAFIGLMGSWACIRAADRLLGVRSATTRVLFLFWPSFLFWSCILGKDPIILLSVSVFILGLISYMKDRRLRFILLAACGAVLGSAVRLWLSPLFAITAVVAVLAALRGRRLGSSIVVGALLIAGGYGASSLLFERLGAASPEALLRSLAFVSQSWAENGGSGQRISVDITSTAGLLQFLPLGMFTDLFRPLPGDVLNVFGVLASMENLVLLPLVVYLVASHFRVMNRSVSRHDLAPIIVLSSFVLGWSVLYSTVSYQNLGTASRFRLQVLPALGVLLLRLAPPSWRPSLHAASAFLE